VADSSPLIGLCRIGMLHLLRETFKQVIVPEAVWREITSDDGSKPGVQELLEASWIERRLECPRNLSQLL
jgi:predicted nucleic acid-binding protein